MICNKCGNEYRDDFDYCINCGEPNPLRVKKEEPKIESVPVYNPQPPVSKADLETNMTVWSIVSFLVALCGPIILDLIFASIAGNRIMTYRETYGALRNALLTNERFVKAARIIGIVKLISFVVLFTIYFIIYFFAIIGMMQDGMIY